MKTLLIILLFVLGLAIYALGCSLSEMAISFVGSFLMLPAILGFGDKLFPEKKRA